MIEYFDFTDAQKQRMLDWGIIVEVCRRPDQRGAVVDVSIKFNKKHSIPSKYLVELYHKFPGICTLYTFSVKGYYHLHRSKKRAQEELTEHFIEICKGHGAVYIPEDIQ